jgi:hypothetical protein
MLIAIISDIHNNLERLDSCLKKISSLSVETIICCGDIDNLETLKKLAASFTGQLFVVRGNSDNYPDDISLPRTTLYKDFASINIDGVKIGFCHEPKKIPPSDILKKEVFDFVFYGHTHKPWIEKQQGVYIANPGTAGGIFYPPTFAVLDSKKKNLELLSV